MLVYFHVGTCYSRKHEVEILILEGKLFFSSARELDVGRSKATPRLNRFHVAIHSICLDIAWKLCRSNDWPMPQPTSSIHLYLERIEGIALEGSDGSRAIANSL
jgi:hypothetical protein